MISGRIFRAIPLIVVSSAAAANDYLDLSLDELLNVPISVASRKPMSQRVTPGVVSVIEGDDIRRSGARDLIDVLRLVPGFDLRLIVSNILGLGVRGHIGSDGRVLMLVDGIEVNEHRFGTAQFGLSFPVESIARIEIVRGSALAMYGGTAELGVINIISRGATGPAGVEVSAGVGVTKGGQRSRKQWGVSAVKQHETVRLSAMAYASTAFRSDRTLSGRGGSSYDMADSDAVTPNDVSLGLETGGLKLRYQYQDVDVTSRYAGTGIQPAAWTFRHRAESALADMTFNPSESLSFNANVMVQRQSPRETRDATGALNSLTRVQRVQGKIGLNWHPFSDWHIATGLDATQERYDAQLRPFPLRPLLFDQLDVLGLYGEVLGQTAWGDITWSSRRDDHQYAGALWSHRVGLTRVSGNWHFKLLASAAKRAPSVEDYSSSANGLAVRKTEKLTSKEFELGYRLNADTQATVNFFDILTRDTLILRNNSDVHTRGLEAGLQTRRSWGHADLNVSGYWSRGTSTRNVQPTEPATGALLDNRALLGFSPWKVSASATYLLSPKMSISPSLVISGPKWVYDVDASTDTTIRFRQLGSTALVNVAIQSDDLLHKGLTLTVGLYNLFAAKTVFAAPITNSTPPVPDMGRELVVNLRYRF